MGAAFAVVIAGMVLSCTPRIDNHGNEIDLDNLVEIEPGKTRKSRVSALLGAPSSMSDFGEDTWFYIGSTTKTVGFFSPELVNRKVVYIAFDKEGVVGSIGKLSEADGKKIEIVDRETPTAGQRITLLQQLIGNIGRFNDAGN
ncbi:MAG: outer membrane protein assembly factor BamE [Alphaproteobacteria bacterium]|jgi:outer membrane protein assembly factor BamE (lipoprotein component of BamABCDE complex)|nr:outer membrane protein assembly factor BamE [Alphaproteobacteria bacterium]